MAHYCRGFVAYTHETIRKKLCGCRCDKRCSHGPHNWFEYPPLKDQPDVTFIRVHHCLGFGVKRSG